MSRLDQKTLTCAELLWEYHRLRMQLQYAKVIVALGSHDLRTAAWAAQLYRCRWAPYVICSGGLGNLTKGLWNEPEAVKFARICRSSGVPAERLMIEPNSTNTFENLKFSRQIIESRSLSDGPIIFVHKPYMERRTMATLKVVWPEAVGFVTSPPFNFLEYPKKDIPLGKVISIMVGDFQRILLYPLKGWQIEQEVPEKVLQSYLYLVDRGFTEHLLHNEPILP